MCLDMVCVGSSISFKPKNLAHTVSSGFTLTEFEQKFTPSYCVTFTVAKG